MTHDYTTAIVEKHLVPTLADTYDLIYVEYDDRLTDEQVTALVDGDWDTFDESFEHWEGEARWWGAKYAAEEAVRDFERSHPHLTLEMQRWDADWAVQHVIDIIQERDGSDFIPQLARRTPDVTMRVQVISEDDSDDRLGAKKRLRLIGLPVTDANVATMKGLIAEVPSTVHMAYALFTLPVADLLGTWPTAVYVVTDPVIVMGNPFAGAYWDAQFEGTLEVKRTDLSTDRGAFGYSVDEVYGGYRCDSTATRKEAS